MALCAGEQTNRSARRSLCVECMCAAFAMRCDAYQEVAWLRIGAAEISHLASAEYAVMCSIERNARRCGSTIDISALLLPWHYRARRRQHRYRAVLLCWSRLRVSQPLRSRSLCSRECTGDVEMNDNAVTFEGNYVQIKSSASEVLTSSCLHSSLSVAMTLCADHRCRRILALTEQHSLGSESDCESMTEAMSELVILREVRLACCFLDGVTDMLRAFVAKLTARYGMTTQCFSDREQALQWLGAK